MGSSTIKLSQVLDTLAAKGIPDPRGNASGYGKQMAIDLATQVMADIVCERFNWAWNRGNAVPFQTNSWQQDYPQLAQPDGPIGWGEDCDAVDINNTSMPKPLYQPIWRRQLSRSSDSIWRFKNISWMYNKDLFLGVWPGPGVVFAPLVTTQPQPQNPIMSMTDVNGNILIVTGFGTTGSTAPELPADSAEGTTVDDGTVVWTCVSPTSQGFRLSTLPPATGPSWKVLPTYQIDPPVFDSFAQTLDPMPDSFSRFFYRGLEAELLMASPNPGDVKRGEMARQAWMEAMVAAMKQGDRSPNVYGLLPASPVVEPRYGYGGRGPYTADQPY